MSEEIPGDHRPVRRGKPFEKLKVFALPTMIGLAAAGLGFASIRNGLDDAERAQQSQVEAAEKATPTLRACEVLDRTELVPASGALFGVNLDWHAKPLSRYAQDLGHKPAVSVSFTGFPYTAAEKADLHRAVEQIRADGHMMLLTLEPANGLADITPDSAAALAADLAGFNGEGIPVIVRFAHEMNGSWYPWSQQPAAYIAAFRTMATAVHTQAPGSAMMWAPNYGGGYPFTGGQYEAEPGTAEFAALDTTGDGVLNMADDAYAPYYPGDDAVDWVGMSLYHWGAAYPWGENELPEPGKFAAQLTGNYVGANGDDSLLPDFYRVYAEEHGKPVAIPETAALFAPAPAPAGGAGEAAIKQAWWGQLFSPATTTAFPQLKMINWFEWDKNEAEVKGRVDWTVTNTAEIRDAFTAAMPDWLRYGPDTSCAPKP